LPIHLQTFDFFSSSFLIFWNELQFGNLVAAKAKLRLANTMQRFMAVAVDTLNKCILLLSRDFDERSNKNNANTEKYVEQLSVGNNCI
jgi:hypothetical protein